MSSGLGQNHFVILREPYVGKEMLRASPGVFGTPIYVSDCLKHSIHGTDGSSGGLVTPHATAACEELWYGGMQSL